MLRTLAVALLSIVALGAPDAAAQGIATGCLTSAGRITKLAVGDEPTRPCGRRETEITLSLGEADVQTFAIELGQGGGFVLAPGVGLECLLTRISHTP